MKGSFQFRRVVVAWFWLLALSRSARSVSFLHGSSSTTRPNKPRGAKTAWSASATTTSSSSSSSGNNDKHSMDRRRKSLWRIFSPRAAATENNSWWTAPLKAKPNATAFPSLASLTTLTKQEEEQQLSTTTTATATTERPPRVHVAYVQEQKAPSKHRNNNKKTSNKNNQTPPSNKSAPSKSNLKIHTFTDARGRIWKALNTPREKFQAFLCYHKVWNGYSKITTHETTTQVDATTAAVRRQEWRRLWKKGQLLTERTEYLAVYPSDEASSLSLLSVSASNGSVTAKRGGFSDLLYLYTQRLLSFLKDEQEDKKNAMIRWLQKEYGRGTTARLASLSDYPPSEQMAYWKEFLEWFRGRFPYYYDRCGNCGASIREDVANNVITDDSHHSGKGHKTFLGYIYPQTSELDGKASRTELYQCHKCGSYTRFPRYNSAWHVIEHRRGRCGEYSMLLYRLLRALGHETRWVVDWADHVWVEVFCERSGAWIHLDPCEAAVNENLLYQGWGKKQTYVLGFYAPRGNASESDHPLIQDITAAYTTDTREEIQARRDERERHVQAALEKSTEYMHQRLASGVYEE